MAIVTIGATIEAPVNEGAEGLFNALVAWLVAHPGVAIIDVDTFRYQSEFSADEQRIRLLYETGAAITSGWQARFYRSSTTTAGASAQEQFNSDMQAGATFVPWFVIDLTKYVPGRASSDTIIVLGVNTATDPFGYNHKTAWIAEPQAAIASGASGTCNIFDGSGTLLGTKTVKNLGSNTWIQYQRDYVVVDEDSGLLVGLPTCDPAGAAFTPPALTTTTSFPCPTYFPQTLPNTASTTSSSTTTTTTTTTTSSTTTTTTSTTTTTDTSTTTAAPDFCTLCSTSAGPADLNGTPLTFTSGPCPWIWGDTGPGGTAVVVNWTLMGGFVVTEVENGIVVGSGSDPSVACNPDQFSGTVTLDNASVVTFGT